MKKSRNRGRNLDDSSIGVIVEILDSWTEDKLTWQSFIERIESRIHVRYTRQALNNHTRIKLAFTAKKNSLPKHISQNDLLPTYEQQRIARLEAEVARLTMENRNLLEQFNRWVYNGFLKQFDRQMEETMNAPLPPINRDPSDIIK